MQVVVNSDIAKWYADHRKARAAKTGHNRNYFCMLTMEKKEEFIQHLCEIYGVKPPEFVYDRARFAQKRTGRNVDYARGTLFSIRTPTFGKHLCWAFYWHYMWSNYGVTADSTELKPDQLDPAEIFADDYWRQLSRLSKAC